MTLHEMLTVLDTNKVRYCLNHHDGERGHWNFAVQDRYDKQHCFHAFKSIDELIEPLELVRADLFGKPVTAKPTIPKVTGMPLPPPMPLPR